MEIKVTVDLADRVVELIKGFGAVRVDIPEIKENIKSAPAVEAKAEEPKTQKPKTQEPKTQEVAMVPTVEKAYSIDELGKAAIGLMDSGKQQDLIKLLSEFGVDALPKIPKDRYSDFALKLRELGADI